jgi:[ribosomal protein S5]-alanine N-acetyltransferase
VKAIATGPRVLLRALGPGDREAFLAATRRSRSLHRPWSYPPDEDEGYAAYTRRDPTRLALAVFRIDDDALCGFFSVSQIFYGPFRSAYLGYYAFVPHAGRGYMREGLHLVLRHAFDDLGLHRLEASIQPANERSIALVRAAGFTREGFSRRYLKIGGRWRDHEHWAILAEDPRDQGL